VPEPSPIEFTKSGRRKLYRQPTQYQIGITLLVHTLAFNGQQSQSRVFGVVGVGLEAGKGLMRTWSEVKALLRPGHHDLEGPFIFIMD